MRHTAALGACAVLGAALAGCASAPPAPPARLSPPIVADPIDLTAFVRAPCGLLDDSWLRTFSVTKPGVPSPAASGTECVWTSSDTTPLAYRASVDTTSGGIETVYRHRATIPAFEPIAIHSYPAVHTAMSDRACTIKAGVANDTLLTITVQVTGRTSAYTDACAETDRFARVTIGYLANRAP